jgi:hypothetical protein
LVLKIIKSMVRNLLIIALVAGMTLPVMAQKKIVPASKSAYTGISLPAGTMEDKRLLSTVSAALFLEEESKKVNVKITTAEVFQLPPKETSGFSADKLKDALRQAGWIIFPVEGAADYGWLQKGDRYLMYYFSAQAKGFDLYFGEADKPPVLAGNTPLTTGQQDSGNPSGSGSSGQPTKVTISNEASAAEVITASKTDAQRKEEPAKPESKTESYTFSTTNWDDGWVSTIEADKVVVTKCSIRVHLYYPLAHDDVSRRAGRDYYWDTYLTKEFRILSKQYRDQDYILQPPYIEGLAIDPKTGRNCFLAYFVTSSNGMMFPVVALAPNEQTFRQTFPKAENEYQSDLAAMSRYNRFAVALPDLLGKWIGGGSAAMNYYNAYTGSYAGMGAVSKSDEFEFRADGTYSSKHQGAYGMVGSMNTYSQSYIGKATVTNWEIVMTNRFDNKTETFHAWFEAVRGGRVLHLVNKQYTGSGYNLVKEQHR